MTELQPIEDETEGPLARVGDWPAIGVPHLVAHRNWLAAYGAARASIETALEANRTLLTAIQSTNEAAQKNFAGAAAALRRAKWLIAITGMLLLFNLGISISRWLGASP